MGSLWGWNGTFQIIIVFIALTDYGWQRSGQKLEVLWDTPDNVAKAQEKVDHVLHGCKCKTGCHTRRCSCKKSMKPCGPGCRCIGCGNVTSSSTETESEDELHNLEVADIINDLSDDGSTDASDDDTDLFRGDTNVQRDVNSLMSSIFGEEDSEDDI